MGPLQAVGGVDDAPGGTESGREIFIVDGALEHGLGLAQPFGVLAQLVAQRAVRLAGCAAIGVVKPVSEHCSPVPGPDAWATLSQMRSVHERSAFKCPSARLRTPFCRASTPEDSAEASVRCSAFTRARWPRAARHHDRQAG
jgi:hypothetical protein